MLKGLLMWGYKVISKFYIRPQPEGFGMGALKDEKDDRDYVVGVVSEIDVPPDIDLREFVPEVKSQGMLGSCVAHAICSAVEMQLYMKDPKRYIALSELYNYYFGRIESGLFPADSGMYPRDAIKSLKDKGLALEVAHPYSVTNYNTPPSSAAISVAHIYSAMTKEYFRVDSDVSMMQQIALGHPIIISVPVYGFWHEFDAKIHGKIRKPITGIGTTDKLEGYHALLIVGYDINGWICLNSWGQNYGDKGFVYLPYGYKMNDAWVLRVE